jgi:hypothetical protein
LIVRSRGAIFMLCLAQTNGSAMSKRKMRADEKIQIAEERRTAEVSIHPRKMIAVRVEDETDENGQPIVWVHYIGEARSKDWKRNA